jgi:hypothetical protein
MECGERERATKSKLKEEIQGKRRNGLAATVDRFEVNGAAIEASPSFTVPASC